MIRDEDGALTGYVYIDLNTNDYGGFVEQRRAICFAKNWPCPPGFTYKWSGEYEFELRAKAAAATDSARRLLRDLPAALHGLSFGH